MHQGYTEAIYRLLNAANITNEIVFGTGNNVSHSWNIVKIYGSFYHLDATFDDPVSSYGPILSYAYFNLSDSQLKTNHTWDTTKYPSCTDTKESYYKVNNLIASDRNSFYNIIKKELQQKQTVIRCKTTSYDTNTFNPQVVAEVVQENKINYINTSKQFLYDYDKSSCELLMFISYK